MLLSYTFAQLGALFQSNPELWKTISLTQLDLFVRLCVAFRVEILLYARLDFTSLDPPTVYFLPDHLLHFLAAMIDVPQSVVQALWKETSHLVWSAIGATDVLTPAERDLVNALDERGFYATAQHLPRYQYSLASTMLMPPVLWCTHCLRPLTSLSRVKVTVFSSSTGYRATKGYSSSLKCKGQHLEFQYH